MWRDARGARVSRSIFDMPGKIIAAKGVTYFIGLKGVKAEKSLIQELQKAELIRRYVSRRHLEIEINEVVGQLLLVDEHDIEVRSEKALLELLGRLNRIPPKWTVIVPVSNLRIRVSRLNFGTVSFRIFTQKSLESYVVAIRQIVSRLARSTEDVERGIDSDREWLHKHFLNETYAEVSVQALDKEKAREIAIGKVMLAISVLRLYACGLIYPDFRGARPYLNIKGLSYQDRIPIFSLQEQPPTLVSYLRRTGYWFEMEIGDQQLRMMEDDGFKVLSDILEKDQNDWTPFESSIISAVSLFGIGTNDENDVNAFINLVTALESLLLTDREPKKLILSERVAFVLGEDYSDRLTMFNTMKDLYQKRSDIVHSGRLDVTRSELYLLAKITYRCIVRLLAKHAEFRDIRGLISWVDSMKFS